MADYLAVLSLHGRRWRIRVARGTELLYEDELERLEDDATEERAKVAADARLLRIGHDPADWSRAGGEWVSYVGGTCRPDNITHPSHAD